MQDLVGHGEDFHLQSKNNEIPWKDMCICSGELNILQFKKIILPTQ